MDQLVGNGVRKKNKLKNLQRNKPVFLKKEKLTENFLKKSKSILASCVSKKNLTPAASCHQEKKLESNNQLVQGKVFKIDQENFYIRFNNKVGICSWKNVSDYPERITKLLKLNGTYVFLLSGFVPKKRVISKNVKVDFYWNLSYKNIHPAEIKYKQSCVPTISGFQNLSVFVNKWCQNHRMKKKENRFKNYYCCIPNFEAIYKKCVPTKPQKNNPKGFK